MTAKNIQRLFSAISLQNIQIYMEQKGWSSIQRGERLDFQRTDPSTQETLTLYIPARADHPKFRHLVPNLVFSLSVIEQREAYEVAENIVRSSQEVNSSESTREESAAKVVTTTKPSQEAQQSNWLKIRNTASSSIEFQSDGIDTVRIPGGESIYLRPNSHVFCLDVQADFRASSNENGPVRSYLDLPGRNASDRSLIISSAVDLFKNVTAAPTNGFNLPGEVKANIERFFFANGVNETLPQQRLEQASIPPLLRTLAMLLSDVHRILAGDAESAVPLFQLCRWLLSVWGITFTANPQAPFQLWSSLLADHGSSPAQTLEWLEKHSMRLDDF